MKNKAIFAIPTALMLTFSTVCAAASETANAAPESSPAAEETVIERGDGRYITFTGKIDDIATHENRVTILVSSDTNQSESTHFNIYDSTVLLDTSTQEHTTSDKLEVGQEVTVAYPSDTPVAMSLPPQINPEVVVVHTTMAAGSVKIDKFDENFLSSDGGLKLNVSDETPIVSIDGKTLSLDALRGEMKNRTLVVFYVIATRSIPPQAPPVKVIVLNEKETAETGIAPEATETPETAEVPQAPFYGEDYYEHEGHVMIPLAKAGAEYGFEVSWDDATRAVTLVGEHSTYNVTIGQTAFDNNGSEAQLSTAPQIRDDRSYVPEEFLDYLTVIKF